MASMEYDPVGTHLIITGRLHIVEMINHKNAVEHRHSEEGDKTYSCRDTERQPAKPQCCNTTYQRQRNGGEYHQ